MKTKLILLLASLGLASALAQPTILSTVPPNLATGVSPTAPVVLTFSEPMNPTATAAQFVDAVVFPPAFLPTTSTWSVGNTILTCTPIQPWPANKMIMWFVDGENPAGDPLDGDAAGVFTTSGSGGDNCTNEIGSLTVGKGALYVQTAPGAPALNPTTPFAFVACGSVACSNWTTTNISLTVPGGAETDIPATPIPGHYSLTVLAANQPALDAAYPNGNYGFTLESAAGNFTCAVNFPASLAFPDAPHLTNFTAAQAVDVTQPFVLGWDGFQGGTATDCIYLEIYGGVFQTPAPGSPGALPGPTRSVTIPAHTLQPNRAYDGSLTFYDLVFTTNACGYVSLAYRAATTEFTLRTASDAPRLAVTLTVTNTVVLSWPLPDTGWRLQSCPSLSALPQVWTEIPPPYSNNAASCYCIQPAATGNKFYRLSKP